MTLQWSNTAVVGPRSYVCGYCNHTVWPDRGYLTTHPPLSFIYICSFCGKPSFFEPDGKKVPGSSLGNEVASLPKDVASLCAEARSSATVNAFTAAVLTCRKLLMHLAVAKGASAGKSFLEYVEHLSAQGYVPPDGKGWVDHIRSKGNEANHEIKIMTDIDAQDLLAFSEMLLKFVYEFPAKVVPAGRSTSSSRVPGAVI